MINYLQRIASGMIVLLAMVLSLAVFVSADESYYLTWDDYRQAHGISSWNYNDIADAIAEVANHAVELYEAGEGEEAYEYARAVYFSYYETSGFERKTMNDISSSRMSEVESAFSALRKSIKEDKGVEAVQAASDNLIEMLTTDAYMLSSESAMTTLSTNGNRIGDSQAGMQTIGTVSGSGIVLFIGSFAIIAIIPMLLYIW